MAISGVNPKCYILALFVRDDGARFLLGEDPFEFKDNQLHFQQNTMANDVVEVQGNDGYLLAGQVRRPGTQVFDGYVCNGTNSKEEVEVKRRSFLQFFRRSHFYKVIYVFPNGTAIQRKQGFLVDDPTVQELYQQYPEYHVALNFEDVNYYTYEEDDQGHEIYAKEAIVPLARGGATGGLIWDNYGVVWENAWSLPLSISGVQFQILNNAGARAPIENVELYGDTYQQTYSGKNLINVPSSYTGTGWKTITSLFPTIELDTYYTLSCDEAIGGENGVYIRFDGGNDGVNLSTSKKRTFRFTHEVTNIYLYSNGYSAGASSGVAFSVKNMMFEKNSTATSYEPFVGRIPAPNPDYPQNVQTVTGEQNVWVHGKNVIDNDDLTYDVTNVNASYIHLSTLPTGIRYMTTYHSTTGSPSIVFKTNIDLTSLAGKTIRLKVNFGAKGEASIYRLNDDNTVATNVGNVPASGETVSWTVPNDVSDAKWLGYRFRITQPGNEDYTVDFTDLIMTIDEADMTYEPYQSQTYPISLGSTELCKIGNYQDYIYKSGDDWYVHKALSKYVFNGNETINYQSVYGGFTISSGNLISYMPGIQTPLNGYSNYFTIETSTTTWTGEGKIGLSASGTFWAKSTAFGSTQQSCETWLSTNTPTVYYALATPTDTKITDATLVGQLNAIDAMKLFIGENNVLVSTPTPNLPATLAFDYYTKFTAIGAEWEEGGTKGATIVNVDAIDNTYPVWQLTGPATNPTLSVLTTNTALTYNGTITASQTLVIDMFNKTATLNGTSVIGNISGDFVYMAPGTNRVAYTAGNTDAPDSTIYWQEVVG